MRSKVHYRFRKEYYTEDKGIANEIIRNAYTVGANAFTTIYNGIFNIVIFSMDHISDEVLGI